MGSPYDYTQQAASECYTTDPLIGVTGLPDGGASYNYLQNGRVVSEPVPPPGFDILTASAAELERYGLPARPVSEPEPSEWQNDYRNARFATPPPFLAEVPAAMGISQPPPPLYVNAHFAGYETTGSGSYTAGSTLFTEPSLQPVSCNSPAIAIWSGIGSTSSSFGQDGTYSLPYNNHNAFAEAWLAGAGSYSYAVTLFRASAYDSIRANVNYSSGTFSGTVTDVTTGVVNGWNSGGGYSGTPNTAEALLEQLTGYSMADFTNVPFSYSQGNHTSLASLPHTVVTNSPNTSVGGINGSGGFNVSWNHC
jgi:Peptidase A4 family